MASSDAEFEETDKIFRENEHEDLTIQEKVDRKYQAIGGFSWSQVIAFLGLAIGGDCTLWIISNLGFFTQQPAYQCRIDGGDWTSGGICTVDNICDQDPSITDYRIDQSDPKTLDNWWQKLDLQCKDKWKYQSIASAYFLGYCFTLLWVPLLSDKYSRKWFFLPGQLLNLVVMTIMLLTTSLDVMLACTFILGVLSPQRASVGYIYLVEMLPKKHTTATVTIWFMTEGFICAFAPLYFWKISKNWAPIFYCGYSVGILSIICSAILPESPRLLVELGKLDEAKRSFNRMAKLNGKKLEWNQQEFNKTDLQQTASTLTTPSQQEVLDQTQSKKSACFFLKQRWIFINLMIMSTIWLASSFNNYFLNFVITTFQSEYLSGIGLGIADMIAYAAGGVLCETIGAQRTILLAWAIATGAGVLLTSYGLKHDDSWIFAVLIFIARLGVSISFNNVYLAHVPMFPTLFCATSLGICNFSARFFSAFSSQLAGLEEPTPMILFTCISALAAIVGLGIQKNPEK